MPELFLKPSRPLTVAIATSGRPLLLKRTLDSLAACEKPASYEGAWIVENGPAGGVEQLVAAYSAQHKFQFVHVPEANKSVALNRVLAYAGDSLVFFSDDDVRFDRHVLSAYENATAGVSAGRFYGGPLEVEYDAAAPPEWMKPLLPKTACGWRRDEDRITRLPRPRFLGPNWAAFASDLRQIGGFEPRLGPGSDADCTGDETEIQGRLRQAGVQGFYVPEAVVWHFVRSESIRSGWIVERAIRHGREWGIQRSRQYPRRMIERYVRLRLRYASWAAGRIDAESGDIRTMLQAAHRVAKWQGRLEGLSVGYGYQWNALPPLESVSGGCRSAA